MQRYVAFCECGKANWRFEMMRKWMFALLMMFSSISQAATTHCKQHYFGGHAPDLVNLKLGDLSSELCFSQFGVVHSGTTRTPLWSAEHLTVAHIQKSMCIKRVNSFHPDDKLGADVRAELGDYAGSGYDRGHMSPNHDMPDKKSQGESFSLANMVPQAPNVNQKIWRKIEDAVRNEVLRGHELYVITGPMFESADVFFLNDRVGIPSGVFKAIYDPKAKSGAAFIATNDLGESGDDFSTISIAELEERIGVILFPSVKSEVKSKLSKLPKLNTAIPKHECPAVS
jgi:endonuclease G